jgi:hypothetical protein
MYEVTRSAVFDTTKPECSGTFTNPQHEETALLIEKKINRIQGNTNN